MLSARAYPLAVGERRWIELPTGELTVETFPGSEPLDGALRFAARRNPRRGFLFVSEIIGRYLPVSPGVLRGACERLAERLPQELPGPVLFVGVAEAGIALAQGVRRAWRARAGREDGLLWHSSRLRLDVAPLARFQEPHSHAPAHALYCLPHSDFARALGAVRTLVLIDDEITTGRTLMALEATLRPHLPRHVSTWALTLSDWSGGEPVVGGRPSEALISGRYRFRRRLGPHEPLPPDVTGGLQEIPLAHTVNEGRLGRERALPGVELASLGLSVTPGQSVLVLGTGEHQGRAVAVAEAVEAAGGVAAFQATTRAPARLGDAIERVARFTDCYGEGLSDHLYSFERDRWDAVWVCQEAPPSLCCPELLRVTGAVLVPQSPR